MQPINQFIKMKTKQILGAVAMVGAAIYFLGCSAGADSRKMLVNKWQISSFQSADFDKQMAKMKQAADTAKDTNVKAEINSEIKMNQAVVEALKSSVKEYKADSTFEMKFSFMGQSQTQKGHWVLQEDKDMKRLIETDDKQKKDTMMISNLTADGFTVTSPDKTVTVTYKAFKA